MYRPYVHHHTYVSKRIRIGIIMGGFSSERHISVESGRNVYEKLASSVLYTPIPIFLSGTSENHQLFILPLNLLLKDSADDIHEKLREASDSAQEATMAPIRREVAGITHKYAGKAARQPQRISYPALAEYVDVVFIALHGRPGEDGILQAILEQHDIPYNGSGVACSHVTMDKFKTNQYLRTQGFCVADQMLVKESIWKQEQAVLVHAIERQFSYPMIAKPTDEGCSTAVVKIKNRAMLQAYASAIFGTSSALTAYHTSMLNLKPNIDFPKRDQFLIEALVEKENAAYFLEVTGGLLTHLDDAGKRHYELFEPSETLARGEILTLEEKFLAGEGQNITPACFHPDPTVNRQITEQVKADLASVAQVLDLEGYARIDAFVKIYSPTRIETWIIEVNTLPGMTPATCIFHQCALHGYRPFDFIHAIIQYSLQKYQQRSSAYDLEYPSLKGIGAALEPDDSRLVQHRGVIL